MKKILIVPFLMLLSFGAFADHDFNIYYSQEFKVWLDNNAAKIDANNSLTIKASDLVVYMNEATSQDISQQTSFDAEKYDLVSVYSNVSSERSIELQKTFYAIKAEANNSGTFVISNLVIGGDGTIIELGTEGSNIPIDGGLSFLLVGGLGFGISRFKRK